MDATGYATIISAITIIVNGLISYNTIRINRDIQRENAGKNRIIYNTEEYSVDAGRNNAELDKKLSSGNYTILNVSVNPSVWSGRIITIGKINP